VHSGFVDDDFPQGERAAASAGLAENPAGTQKWTRRIEAENRAKS
jgi:hypothetical protein